MKKHQKLLVKKIANLAVERLIHNAKQNKAIHELEERADKMKKEMCKLIGVVNYMAFMMLIRKGKMTDKYKNKGERK